MPTRSPAAGLIPHLRRAVFASDAVGLTDGQLLGEFLRTHDGAAFAALVRRHGPMVLGVCRRVVGDPHAAEDAFQAVFLVLARRAAAVRPREQVGNFLYGVAYRTALKARALRARRRAVETQVDPMPHPEAKSADVWPDLQPVIDAELARLPDKFRLPVVLCDLEGRPQREVARQLGLPPATLANRLASARRTLAKRLTDRGVTLSGGALATAVSANAATAAVPHALTASAVRAAGAAAGGAAAGAFPAHVVQLSDGVMRMMMLAKLKAAAVAVLAAAVVAGGFGVGALPAAAADDKPAAKADPAKPGLGPNLTDEEFLKRVCLDLRGDAPTRIEMGYFLDDKDAAKRKKVVGWLADGEKQATADALMLYGIDLPNGNVVWNEAYNNTVLVDPSSSLRPATVNGNAALIYDGVTVKGTATGGIAGLTLRTDYPDLGRWLVAGSDPNTVGVRYALLADGSVRRIAYHPADTDEAFLRRVCLDARGTPPTRIEVEYFVADQDPKKREKLIDLLLKDAEVAKKVGDGWKQKVLAPTARLYWTTHPPLAWTADGRAAWTANLVPYLGQPDRFDTLIGQLLDGKRADDHVLDTLTAAFLGRLPTESERAFVLGSVSKAADKKAAWTDVVFALTNTKEAKQYAEELKARTTPQEPEKK